MSEIIIDGVRFISEDDLKSMAEHVRAKGGTKDLLTVPDGFNAAVDAIQTGGGTSEFASIPVYFVCDPHRDVTSITIPKINALSVCLYDSETSAKEEK